MRVFTADELVRMRGVQGQAMMDACLLHTWTPIVDDYGTETIGWTDTGLLACGLDVSNVGIGGSEQRRNDGTIVSISATLRLSLADGQGVTEEGQVTIIYRNQEALVPPLVYGIAGQPQRGPTGYVLQLMEIR